MPALRLRHSRLLHASRVTLLLALLTSATVAWAEDPVSPVPIIVARKGSVVYIDSVSSVPDISADGRTLLVRNDSGLVLYDVVANSSTQVQGLGEINDAGLLAQP